MFGIKSDSGTNISIFSNSFQKEAEILLSPNSYYLVDKIQDVDGITYVVMTEADTDEPEHKNRKVKHIHEGFEMVCS